MLLCISTCDTRSTLSTFHTHHTQMQLAESFLSGIYRSLYGSDISDSCKVHFGSSFYKNKKC